MPLTRHPPAPQRSSKAGSTLGTACRALPAAASVHRRGRSAPRAPPVVLARAVGDGGAAGGDADKPDIDQLASMLSQQAAKMRASMGSMDEPLVVEEEPPEEQSAAAARMMPEGGVFASLVGVGRERVHPCVVRERVATRVHPGWPATASGWSLTQHTRPPSPHAEPWRGGCPARGRGPWRVHT